MNIHTDILILETPDDFDAVEKLAEAAFGPGRFARSAFRLREGVMHEPELSFVLWRSGQMAGSVRLTKILIGEEVALLLGPLVVAPEYKNTGVGAALMLKAVEVARNANHQCILLVGDLSYYERFGFEKIKRGQITLPGPADPDRILICPLKGDASVKFQGEARRFL